MTKPAATLTLSELQIYEPHLTLTHVGDYEACVMVFAPTTDDVTTMLPAGLQLVPQSITPSGQHPVLVFVGQQVQVRGIRVRAELCPLLRHIGLCMYFLEAAIAIPFVKKVGAATAAPSLFCSVKLYLTEMLPIYLGWLAGFPKQRGLITRSGNSFDVLTETSAPLLNLTFAPQGPFQSLAAFPNFPALRPMFEQPHIGRLFSLGTSLVATFVCSEIDLKLSAAQGQSVTVQGTLTPQFSSVLPGSFNFPGIDSDPLGAFRIRTTWELPPPGIC